MTTVWKIVERILSSVTTNPVKCYFPTTRHLCSMCQEKTKCFYHCFISVWFCWKKKKTKNKKQKGILMEGNMLHAFQKTVWLCTWNSYQESFLVFDSLISLLGIYLLKNHHTIKDLLYCTGNSTQYSELICMGKESKNRADICICVADSLHWIAETNATL